ncbi:MAG: hypothetical protein RE471_05460 [Ferroplasma sp.]|uniref:hypothetical protein n=1 Tax=Ferroplasma sp. TaxID=2591003 RepID=UPI002814C6ED|nr:hypothetical protein [Ferroplasma sp.]WMT50429.1 MAG: hypothetical protein RE471_05460 [Ferroplasma sp.]
MKTYKKIITGLIIMSMIMLAIGASGITFSGNGPDVASPDTSYNNDMAVTSVSWFSPNSTELPAPGSNGVPLYVTFTSYITITDANVSLNLSAYKSPLSYAYISGQNYNVRTYNIIPEIEQGHSYTIMQLVNISKESKYQYYDENITYSNTTISGSTTFAIPVGHPQIGLISYVTNPPVIYQTEKFIKLTAYTENTGTSAMKNVNVNITSKDYKIVSPVQYSIAYYPAGKLMNFTFYINAKNVTGNAPVELHINNSTYTLNTVIHSNGKNGLSVSVLKKSLVSDTKKQIMIFYLNDTGNRTYLDLQIHMLSPSIISIHVSSSNPLGALTANNVTFAQIKPGESITVTYVVDTSSVPSGNYPVQMLVEYHFNNTAETFDKVYTYNQKIVPTTTEQVENTMVEPLYAGLASIIIVILISIAGIAVHSKRKSRDMENKKHAKNQEKKSDSKKNE